jgi:hypothetical protein
MPVAGMCFSYPQRGENRSATRSALPGPRQLPASTACFRYQPDVPRSVPYMCFGYPPAGPVGLGNRDDVPPAPSGLRQMPVTTSCFRY